jgi:uncharacterized protein YbjT (DUF2867 family)
MYVVAGVTGHVGKVVAQELLARNAKVKVIVRDAAKGAAWAKQGAELAVGALEDQAFLAAALKGAQGFFTLLPPNFAAPDFYGWQRKQGDTIAAAVRASGVPHVVMLSSVGADLAEGNGPIKGLHHLENALRATGTVVTAIRAGFFQENTGNSLKPMREMGIFPNFGGPADYEFPMIATKDIGMLVASSLLEGAKKSEIVDLHGPAYSTRQVVEKFSAALGKKIQIIDIPPPGHVEALTKAGFPKHVAEVFAEMYAGFASGKIMPHGDRLVQGKTAIDETIKTLVG